MTLAHVVTLAARALLVAWIAGTILGAPFLSVSESSAARAIRRTARRMYSRR